MGMLIGLTGKTGAGKSTVCGILRANGAYIIDGDVVARKVLKTDTQLLFELRLAFGDEIFLQDGTLCRSSLAKKAFASPLSVQKLNGIMHPAITRAIMSEVEEAFKTNRVVVVDAAALIEAGINEMCDYLIVVKADEKTRLERIMARDHLTGEEALLRVKAQKDDAFYEEKADFVIRNESPYLLKAELEPALKVIFS